MTELPTDDHDAGLYEIRVAGHLDQRWAAWFDGSSLAAEGDGTTVIRGTVADQAALHGLLRKVSDIGLPLVSVTRVDDRPGVPAPASGQPATPSSHPAIHPSGQPPIHPAEGDPT